MAKSRTPVPEGCHTVQAYLIVPNAVEAIAFYKKAFGAEEGLRMPGPDGRSTVHAEIRIGDSTIYLGDENPHCGMRSARAIGGSPVTLHLYVADADALFKRAVAAGAQVKQPLEDMFWGDRYGKVIDPFGLEWGIATNKEVLSAAELAQRSKEYFAKMA